MKKLSIGILCWFLVIGLKVHGMTLYSTYDTNSTEGNFFGGLFFSFSTTNSTDYHFYTGYGDQWVTTGSNQTFTDPISKSQIAIQFSAGLAEAPGELNLSDAITVNDPAMGAMFGSLGNGSSGYPYDEVGRSYFAGQPSAISYAIDHTSAYYSFTLDTGGNCNFGYSLTGNFDGTSGNAVGSWYVKYPVPPVTPAPEPAVTLQFALGGLCLWLARARHKQRRQN